MAIKITIDNEKSALDILKKCFYSYGEIEGRPSIVTRSRSRTDLPKLNIEEE